MNRVDKEGNYGYIYRKRVGRITPFVSYGHRHRGGRNR